MRINGMRGLLREFGVISPKGAQKFLAHLPQLLEQHREQPPERVRCVMLAFWAEVQELEAKMQEIEQELQGIAQEPRCANHPSWPGRRCAPPQRPDIRLQPYPSPTLYYRSPP